MAALKLSITLIIVIAVSGLVGCVIVLFTIFRCCRRPKSAPLPPIQPLAHHREMESSYLSHPSTFRNSFVPNQLGMYESDSSLLKPSGKPSFQTDGSDGTPSSSDNSFSNSSPQTNVTPSPQAADEQLPATQQHVLTTRQARSVSRGPRRPRSRVISAASTNTVFTQVSPRPTSIIRGAPHSIHSNVQIVLPAPLAPQLQNHSIPTPPSTSHSDRDLSIQDPSRWRKTSSSSGHQHRRSVDTMDQARRSESQTRLRGRSTSDRSIPFGTSNTPPPLPSLGDQTQPPKTPSQDPRDGQGNFPTGTAFISTELHQSVVG